MWPLVGYIVTVHGIQWDMMQCPSVAHRRLHWDSAWNTVGHEAVSQCGPYWATLGECMEYRVTYYSVLVWPIVGYIVTVHGILWDMKCEHNSLFNEGFVVFKHL